MAQFNVLSRNLCGGIETSHKIIIISIRMVSLRAEIRARDLPDMEQDSKPLDDDIRFRVKQPSSCDTRFRDDYVSS